MKRPIAVAFVLALFGCCPVLSAGSGKAKLQETQWVATRINGDAIKGSAPTLTIKKDHAYGSSSCNRYTGKVTLDDNNTLQFGLIASTRMACLGDADRQEIAFFKALQSVTSYHLNQGDLILLDKEFNKLIEFRTMQESRPR